MRININDDGAREQREAEDRFESHLNYTWRDLDELSDALNGLSFRRLAEIAQLSTRDEAEAGRQFRRAVTEAIYDHARASAGVQEVVPPLGGWKPTREPVSLLPLVSEMFADRLGAASLTSNAAPSSLSVVTEVADQTDEPARLRGTGAI